MIDKINEWCKKNMWICGALSFASVLMSITSIVITIIKLAGK